MTELQLAKRVIKELRKQIQILETENNFIQHEISEEELNETKNVIKPERFKDKELAQMMHSLIKLTGDFNMSAKEIAYMLNTDLTDVDRVLNKIDNLLQNKRSTYES